MQIARSELYRLVSERPLSKVAPDLGISPTALAQLCKSNQVPYPGSGYWTRKSLGMPVELGPLPLSDQGIVQIEVVRRATHKRALPTSANKTAVQNPIERPVEASPIPSVVVPARLTKPHHIIVEWLQDREERTKRAAKSRDHWERRMAPLPWTDLDHRRHRILDTVFKAVEARGGAVATSAKGLLRVTIDGEKIEFQVREKARQVKFPADGKTRRYPATELVGTGLLVFAIKTYLRGPYNEEWKETEKRPLEAQVSQIVDRLFEGAKILKAWHIEKEEEAERWRLERERRAELERRRKLDQARKAELVKMIDQWQTAKRLREYLTVITSSPYDADQLIGDMSVGDWLTWAENFVSEQEAQTGTAAGLFEALNSVVATA
jgi:hypothetical protein